MRRTGTHRRRLLVVGLVIAGRTGLALRRMLDVASTIIVTVAIRAIGAITLWPILRSLPTPVTAVTAPAPLHVVSRVDPVVMERFQHALTQCGIQVGQRRPGGLGSLWTLTTT